VTCTPPSGSAVTTSTTKAERTGLSASPSSYSRSWNPGRVLNALSRVDQVSIPDLRALLDQTIEALANGIRALQPRPAPERA
jgi:hypothetical protein